MTVILKEKRRFQPNSCLFCIFHDSGRGPNGWCTVTPDGQELLRNCHKKDIIYAIEEVKEV